MTKDNNDILLLLLIGVIVYFLFFYNKNIKENLDISMNELDSYEFNKNLATINDPTIFVPGTETKSIFVPTKKDPIIVEAIENNTFKPLDLEKNQASIDSSYTLNININDPTNKKFAQQAPEQKPKLTSTDLLPGKPTEKWFETPEVGTKIEDANLLTDAIMKVGVDTVGQTRKNPSYDIRGTIPCPKFSVSPWNNSTYEPDINLKTMY